MVGIMLNQNTLKQPALHLPATPSPHSSDIDVSTLTHVRLGCVPEHFSVPLYIAIQNSVFVQHGLNLELIWCPGGTGEMVKKLNAGELEIALALTEGVVNVLLQQEAEFKIIGTYTRSPLIWSIAVHPDSNIASIPDLKSHNCSISRFNSGSHIISYLLALQQNWIQPSQDPFKFFPAGDINGLIKSIHSHESDFFLWEYYTTKPHFPHSLKLLGNITPPWPAFSVAASNKFLSHPSLPLKFLSALTQTIKEWNCISTDEQVAHICRILPVYLEADILNWLKGVTFFERVAQVNREKIEIVKKVLFEAGVWDGKAAIKVEDICSDLVEIV